MRHPIAHFFVFRILLTTRSRGSTRFLSVIWLGWLLTSAFSLGTPLAVPQSARSTVDAAEPGDGVAAGDGSAEPVVDDAASFLDLMGISTSEWAVSVEEDDGDPVASPLAAKLLRAARRLPAAKIGDWRSEQWTPQQIVAEPSAFWGQLLDFHGRVLAVEVVPAPVPLAEDVGTIFLLDCRSANDPSTKITLICRDIPRRFQERMDATGGKLAGMDEQIRAVAFFLSSAGQGNPADLILVADHVAWYPDQPDSPLIESDDWLILASHGMDMAAVDGVRDRRPLESNDRECFYQLLSAVRRMPLDKLQDMAVPAGAIRLLQSPETHRLHAYTVRGTARRAIRIEVDDAEIIDRFGISHYYEVELFDAEATVRVKAGSDQEDAVFNSYPIVCCVASLPAEFPTGDIIHEPAEISGVYLKLWAYDSVFLQQSLRKGAKQLSPLLIGKTVVALPPNSGDLQVPSGWTVGATCVIGLACLIAFLWWSARRDERFRRTTLAKYRRETRSDQV